MAVKTITIDMEAYELLARAKKPGQSFSQVIKERVRGGLTGRDLARFVEEVGLSKETVDAIDDQVKARRASRPRVPRL
jgi:predicted CopG family antitoxin